MLKKYSKHILFSLALTSLIAFVGATPGHPGLQSPQNSQVMQQPDTTQFDFKRIAHPEHVTKNIDEETSPIIPQPENISYRAEYDPQTGLVNLYKMVGDIPVKLPYSMTVEEYRRKEMRQSMLNYWDNNKLDSDGAPRGSGIQIGAGKAVESIFGSGTINIRPQGIAELQIGVNHTRIDNPTLQERMRKTTTFDFQEKIQMNITGNIGDKLRMGINYNTEATFDFENQINLEYTGHEDEILQKVEAGNVTLPLPGTLITGSQSLFGVKTEMQFGRLTVTSIFSQQKGETSTMDIQGGAQQQDFEISADEYDKNRHFFLSHHFRERYNEAMKNLPVINSPFNITKIEVWITNRSNDFDESRNIIAFADLAESSNNLTNPGIWSGQPGALPSNDANNLYQQMNNTYSAARDINQVSSTFAALESQGFRGAREYEKIENARLLDQSQYTLHSKLGYISLNSPLNDDEVLAVAYEYTYNGQVYKVGELSTSGIEAPSSLYLKLLKGTLLSPRVKTWDLMMKNIYAIGAYQVSPEDFIMDVVYLDDSQGSFINYFPEGPKPDEGGINGELLISVMGLDRLDGNQEPYPDGTFDFVPGYTILADQGRVVFPVVEPFGQHLEGKLSGNPALIDKYVFNALYDSTLTVASQFAEKNKFKLRGTYKSSVSSEISLNAFNIPEGSVVVTAGGIRLTENQDYSVDYTTGRIRILNEGLLESGTPIQVSLESQEMFNLQTKTLLGTHLNYQFNEDFNVGATLMHLRERPLTQKVNFGDEPIANTIWGLNTAYYTESNGLTNLIDKLPMVETTTPSSVSFEGEFAQLVPGHPNVIEEEGTSYIDDFEGSEIPIDIKNWTAWKLASTPQGQSAEFPEAGNIDDLSYGFNRAKIAWYVIDPLFLRNNNLTPGHLRQNPEQQSSHFVREVFEKEIFPYRESAYGEPTNIPVLNLAYYPDERGPYNFDTNLSPEGKLNNPEERWAGIMREIQTSDFESANVEYIEFWVMDPFVYEDGPNQGGDMYINLGNISEDILRDSRKFFEQGMPGPEDPFAVDSTAWGYIPTKQSLVNAFSNDPEARFMQDIGLDGLNSDDERTFYQKNPHPFIQMVNNLFGSGGLSEEAHKEIMNDPSADDYHHYRGSDFDRAETGILDRYKNFNNPEGNSVPSEYSDESYSTASSTIPDGEDINRDNTLSETESYFQYHINLRPENMNVGENFITDEIESTVKLKNGKTSSVKWYQFKVPVSEPDTTVGELRDLSSVRFMRMYLKNFRDTVILRFATMDLVRSDWRKYNDELFEIDDMVSPSPQTQFEVATVNIEENGTRKPVNYVLPPGIDRVIDPGNPQIRQLNEQSIVLKASELAGGDARAVYKTLNMDMRQYRRIKMEVHAEEVTGYPLEDDEIVAFIRLGTDFKNNYYEYEIPLKLTPAGTYSNNSTSDRFIVWPEDNRFDIPIELLQKIKIERNDATRRGDSNAAVTRKFILVDPENPDNYVGIKGNPSLANVRSIMIGIRNNSINNKTTEVWFNELRLSDFDEEGGWAANARMNVKLADLGSISMAGKVQTIGFGGIEQSVNERSQEDYYQYDIATNLELGKLLGPESRLSAPMYVSVSEQVATPEYFPLDPDIPMDVAMDNASTKTERDSIKDLAEDHTKRKSFNLTNVRLKPKENKAKIYDISNLSATYSYNETEHRDVNTEYKTDKNYRGILAYNYSAQPKIVEPFKKVKGNALRLVRDFNFYLLPSQINYRWELMRDYTESQLRNVNNPNFQIPVSVRKDFNWNRYFEMTYNLSKSLKVDFRTTTNARIDEPEGPVNRDLYKDEYELWKDSVMGNIMSLGRTTNYQHNINASYRLPINKLPMMDWTSANVNYGALFNWQQGPITKEDYNWGNTIRNSNTIQGNAQLNFTGLFNKVQYIQNLSRPQRQAGGGERLRFTSHNLNIEKDTPLTIEHKLDTRDVQVRIFDSNGRPIQGQTQVIDANTVTFTASRKISNARTLITGQRQLATSPIKIVADNLLKIATGIKNVSISYSSNNGTALPGYMPESGFLGNQNVRGTKAPGIPFLLGWQDRDFAMKAVENNWLTTDSTLNSPYIMTHSEDLSIRATIEPIDGLRIDLNASRRYSNNMNEYYLFNGDQFRGVFNTTESGSFSMSFNTLATAFENVERSGTYESEAFNQFLENREVIAQRLGEKRVGSNYPETGDYENTNIAGLAYNPSGYPDLGHEVISGVDGYNLTSREVLVPAFLAAYSGKSADNIFTETFPSLMHLKPNWRINYTGLSKISFLKKYIKSFDVSHAYSSTYSIGNYQTNLEWEKNGDGLSFVRDAQDNFIPKYLINGVTIAEQFSPFLQFNITWAGNFSTRAEYKKGRILNLSLNNNQLIENYNNEWVIGLGYRFDQMDMILGKSDSQKKISSDLNLRADLSFRENFSIIRKIQEQSNQMTAGQKVTTLKITADYVLSDRFNVQLFYDKQINNPYISSSYPTYNTNVGVSFRFSLAQ
ncbi:T9SS outer membrane translocon Sov/SprA [Marinilabilia rubra]|uniref:Cell surface protein SprA n=1 Tax=Marinilabilia rubra TaxID=2162893 RepID=A0A2U2B806_9BACT|nr:cell surface protein SprA [Marinilabilia rubra]PWD99199.1 cell surface protein SprA [Marinilabilia rubra]